MAAKAIHTYFHTRSVYGYSMLISYVSLSLSETPYCLVGRVLKTGREKGWEREGWEGGKEGEAETEKGRGRGEITHVYLLYPQHPSPPPLLQWPQWWLRRAKGGEWVTPEQAMQTAL